MDVHGCSMDGRVIHGRSWTPMNDVRGSFTSINFNFQEAHEHPLKTLMDIHSRPRASMSVREPPRNSIHDARSRTLMGAQPAFIAPNYDFRGLFINITAFRYAVERFMAVRELFYLHVLVSA